MGKDIADAFGAAAEIFQQANEILDFDLRRLCFEGPAQQLSATTVSQPAIFVTSVAILNMLKTSPAADRIRPSITAGLSLGEYTALYAAGLVDFEQALLLVSRRGQAMQEAADAQEGGMVSIIGLDEEKAKQLCAEGAQGELLEAVNFNCPGQIVLSGTRTACRRAEQLAPKYEAIKAVPLDVAGAFHTDMMAAAAAALERALADAAISDPAGIKVIANVNAEYYQSADEIRQGLTKQLACPILWQECMEKLIADGVEQFYEIGPGRVLTGLMKRINRRTKVVNLSTLDAVNQFIRS
jgi:[acyl-carrier-protein] S-malonyltransferase